MPLLSNDTSGFILDGNNMLEEKNSKTGHDSNNVKGNEAEEFIKRIVLKVLLTTVVLVVGVGIAVYYTSGAV
ncbi:MAG: hypothetical protein V7765_21045 [Oleispira sp.]